MRSLASRIERFWFRPVSTLGFGLMRVCVGCIGLSSYLLQWPDVIRYYSDAGFMPQAAIDGIVRGSFRFSLFDVINDPQYVFALYLLLLLGFFLMMIGAWTRTALIVTTILLFSLHEGMPTLLAGGDTVMRLLMFILLLSPCHRSFSVWSMRKRYSVWRTKLIDPKERIATMPIWPYRLLLWQFIMIYVGSLWTKLHGSMWLDGSAVGIALHHEHFNRFPIESIEWLIDASPILSYFFLLAQASWLLLLIVPMITMVVPILGKPMARIPLKRIILLTSCIAHLGIAVFMDVGIFSFVMFAGYLGLLDASDFAVIRGWFNRKRKKKIAVLFDGNCGYCRKTVLLISSIDWLHRFSFINYHDAALRKKIAPQLKFADLDRTMHMIFLKKTLTGFYAYRRASWHIPLSFIFTPLFYLPGVSIIGNRVFAYVSKKRKRCDHESCR